MLLDENFRVEPRTPRRWRYRALGLLAILGAACSLLTLQPARSVGQSDSPRLPGEGQRVREPAAAPVPAVEKAAPLPVAQLPVYQGLWDPYLRKRMGIKFSAEQAKKLREIFTDWTEKSEKLSKNRPKSGDPQELANYQASYEEKRRELAKQVDAVLTSEQLQAYWKGMLAEIAFSLAENPQGGKALGLTRQQQEKLDQAKRQFNEQDREDGDRYAREALAVLGPQQREELRSEVERDVRSTEDTAAQDRLGLLYAAVLEPDFSNSGGTEVIAAVLDVTSTSSGTIDAASTELPVYTELGEAAVARELDLSAVQRKRLADIAAAYHKEAAKLAGEMKNLKMEERRRPESLAKATQGLAETRRQVETLLTPQQLAALKEIGFRNRAFGILRFAQVQAKIAPDDRQKTALDRIFQERDDKSDRLHREAQGKSLDVLTRQQQDMLRTWVDEADAAKFKAAAAATAPAAVDRYPEIMLPVYDALADPELRKEMGIDLTAEQWKGLSQIAADCKPKMSAPITAADWKQLVTDARKQVEAVLTPQQLQAYKKGMLPYEAFDRYEPEVWKTLGITPAQEEKIGKCFNGLGEQGTQEMERATEGPLAALSPQQRDKLRSEIEEIWRKFGEDSFLAHCGISAEASAALTLTVSGTITAMASTGGTVETAVPPTLPVYSELEDTETAIARKLGVSAGQRKQLANIAAEFQTQMGKLIEETKKLSPDQRKQPEVRAKAVRLLDETRRRIETLLTPQQLADLKETDFRRNALMFLWSSETQKKIGLDERQKASLERVHHEVSDKLTRLRREDQRKAFAVLTPEQQEKLRAEVDRRGW